MKFSSFLFALGISLISPNLLAQISGEVHHEGEGLPFAEVALLNAEQLVEIGTLTDLDGNFEFGSINTGNYTLQVEYSGFQAYQKRVRITKGESQHLVVALIPTSSLMDQVVVTGTRTSLRQSRSPIKVNVMNSKALQSVQACNLSEGLQFQPGLRVETDCQTCNYTQLRMNGLSGAYSQVLINGRPIFSPLVGLYGLEQIPTTMIDRIEVVTGAGSALYGSSAIGGTVNVITKIPERNSLRLMSSNQMTGMTAPDHIISGNANMVHPDKRKGLSIFFNLRDREALDVNGDNYSEIPEIRAASLGISAFLLPRKGQKIEFSLSSLNEYRYGGEITRTAPHTAGQAEERDHNIWVASLDHQINFNKNRSSVITYLAGQVTTRDHFTGIRPDAAEELQTYVEAPPYGTSQNYTWQGGVQLNHQFEKWPGVRNVVTIGTEYLFDDILDRIDAYGYVIDQNTRNLGTYLQHNWTLTRKWTVVSGLRADIHNLLDQPSVNPRISILHDAAKGLQFRASAGTGFRAPQAFDADMHIAFAGGGVSRINLDPNLQAERSNSYTFSLNYERAKKNWIAGFSLEAFYTELENSFYLHPTGEDIFGLRFEKRNGDGAVVQGVTLDMRGNFNRRVEFSGAFTVQRSEYASPVSVINNLPPESRFLRTPNNYGFVRVDWTPLTSWSVAVNTVYTGSMMVAHFAGAPEQEFDEIVTSNPFVDLGIKLSKSFDLPKYPDPINVFVGVKNAFNNYQSDFDTGKDRDSNYIYGPALPRSIYFGVSVDISK